MVAGQVPRKESGTTYLPGRTSPAPTFHAMPAFSFRQRFTAEPAALELHFESPTRASVTPCEPIVTTIATLPASEGSAFCPNSWYQNRENDCSRSTAAISAGGACGIGDELAARGGAAGCRR